MFSARFKVTKRTNDNIDRIIGKYFFGNLLFYLNKCSTISNSIGKNIHLNVWVSSDFFDEFSIFRDFHQSSVSDFAVKKGKKINIYCKIFRLKNRKPQHYSTSNRRLAFMQVNCLLCVLISRDIFNILSGLINFSDQNKWSIESLK